MSILSIPTRPFLDQRPGTSGLRKAVATVQQPHYLENFVQAVLDTLGASGKTLVLGGDGRFWNDHALQVIALMCAANGVRRLLIGQHGLLSTPAVSHLIRHRGADGGFVLSASHNPGGADGDFGIKFNIANGGPAPEAFTEAVFARTKTLTAYRILDANAAALDCGALMTTELGAMTVEIVDSVAEYAALMARLFDFERMRDWLRTHRLRFDAMHAVTGPYAQAILGDVLGAPSESLLNCTPLPNFGGGHPDPNPVHAAALWAQMHASDAPDLGAASDGDGDRNLILGARCYVTPSDSLAILLANAHHVPGYRDGIVGVARSMPTSRAVDAVAAALGIPCFETPTGWKFFGNLLDHGRIALCGEESFGTSSHHVREKDGLWAVLFWLNLLAVRGQSVREIVDDHWRQFGRVYYTRHDYEGVDGTAAAALFTTLRDVLPRYQGKVLGGLTVTLADDFSYRDPIDGSESRQQGLRLGLGDDCRVIWRLSGTGTVGATVRVYFEQIERDKRRLHGDPQAMLAELIQLAEEISQLRRRCGRQAPDVVT